MGFGTKDTAYFQIRPRHRAKEVAEVIDGAFQGVITTDRSPTYDARIFEAVDKQKCLSHILQNLSKLEKKTWGRAKSPKLTIASCPGHWTFLVGRWIFQTRYSSHVGCPFHRSSPVRRVDLHCTLSPRVPEGPAEGSRWCSRSAANHRIIPPFPILQSRQTGDSMFMLTRSLRFGPFGRGLALSRRSTRTSR